MTEIRFSRGTVLNRSLFCLAEAEWSLLYCIAGCRNHTRKYQVIKWKKRNSRKAMQVSKNDQNNSEISNTKIRPQETAIRARSL